MENRCFAKISVKDKSQIDVVYYRCQMSVGVSVKWRWFFEYLAAKIKVSNPRKQVILECGSTDLLQGQEYVEQKTKTLLKAKKGQLNRLKKEEFDNDLFNFAGEKREEKMERIKNDVESLEQGVFNHYVPPTYINEVKEWIK